MPNPFETTVAGIPCLCHVTYYSPARPMVITGSGFGDAEPPEPEEFEFKILDRSGHLADWLEDKLTNADSIRLKTEYLNQFEDF